MNEGTGQLSTPAARRMISYVSPIYADARRFLAIMDALGLQMQQSADWASELKEQSMPQSATWSLPFWETEYALAPSKDMPESGRRMLLTERVRAFSAPNPAKLMGRAQASCGHNVRLVENTGRNTYTLYVKHYIADEKMIRQAVDEINPAHLIYLIKCEHDAGIKANVIFGMRYARTYKFRLGQADGGEKQ